MKKLKASSSGSSVLVLDSGAGSIGIGSTIEIAGVKYNLQTSGDFERVESSRPSKSNVRRIAREKKVRAGS